MRSAASSFSRGAVCAVALMSWAYGPPSAAANDDAAHALAEKFSQAGEESKRNEDAKAAKVRAKAQAEAKKQAEAAKNAAADRRAADEAEMLRAAQEEAEARRKQDQAREEKLIEAERQAAREDAQRLAEEAQKQKAEMERKAKADKWYTDDEQAKFIGLCREYDNLFADISALTQVNRLGHLGRVLRQEQLHGRLLYGTDMPLVNMCIVSPFAFPFRLSPRRMLAISRIARTRIAFVRSIARLRRRRPTFVR